MVMLIAAAPASRSSRETPRERHDHIGIAGSGLQLDVRGQHIRQIHVQLARPGFTSNVTGTSCVTWNLHVPSDGPTNGTKEAPASIWTLSLSPSK
ncbi:MAG: hypothetical protein MZV64_23980 [Ignavibacteriales bacterium]|nr:hypothetical protein [Ignavibacteriales bacterium]